MLIEIGNSISLSSLGLQIMASDYFVLMPIQDKPPLAKACQTLDIN